MTSIHKVYEAFLSKMLEDEWLHWTEEEIEADWRQLLDAAIPKRKKRSDAGKKRKKTSAKSKTDSANSKK